MRPTVCDPIADSRFRQTAAAAGLNPDSSWIGGYVDYQWDHSRHAFEALPRPLRGLNVLEFGCNFGASSIVLASLGAKVTGVDVDPRSIAVAKCNAARYGLLEKIDFLSVPETSKMPFPDQTFDVVSCISVFEYVREHELSAVQREVDRVLKVGGLIMVAGTSNRVWPRENHSRRWFVHYIPKRLTNGLSIERGVTPWSMRFGFGGNYVNVDREDRGAAYLGARRAMGGPKAKQTVFRAINCVSQAVGSSPGLWMPNISVTLRKVEE